jgi:hypothetical protein
MGLGGPRFNIQKAEGFFPSAFLCGLISVEFFQPGELA